MNKKKLRDDIDLLINIPCIERILYHKVQEMKSLFKDQIEEYKNSLREYSCERSGELWLFDENKKSQEEVRGLKLKRNSKRNRKPHLRIIKPL